MPKYLRYKKICNCLDSNDNDILNIELKHSFCTKCGSILLKNTNGNINYTIRPKHKKFQFEINPLDIIKTMKKNTEINYPDLINEFNMNKEELMDLEKSNMSIDIYLRYRKMILILLQKLIKNFDLNDIIFYQCLFYMDYILSHKMNHEISAKEIIYYLIGYFLCSLKMREAGLEELPFSSLMNIKEDVLLSKRKISYYEVLCLKSFNYNIYSYSAYDWIVQLIGIGIVFNSEIDNKNSIIKIKGHRHTVINSINKYAFKMLLDLTLKDVFIKYSPMYIAFSIIQISRERFLDKNLINHDLFNKLISLYGISKDDYKKCYEELKLNITNNFLEEEKNEEEKINVEYNNNDSIKKENQKYLLEENNFFSSRKKINKDISFNNSKSHKDLLFQKQKENPSENNLKDEKNKSNTINKKSIEKISNDEEKINESKNHFTEMKKNKSRKINHILINSKKKTFMSQDSFPFVNNKNITIIEPIKENYEKNLMNINKANEDIHNCLQSKVFKSKDSNPFSNISNSNININKMDKTLHKISSAKKNLFNITSNKTKNTIYKLGKSNSVLLVENNAEDAKIINNNSLFKKRKHKKSIKLKENFRYNLGFYTRTSLLSNKKK